MLDIYKHLTQLYKQTHQQHLIYCLEEHADYYEGSFSFDGVNKSGDIIVNGKPISKDEIIYTIAIYYEDETMDYQTPFKDFVYLCFTDLADESVDIFELLEEIA